ncbi:Arylsulphatase [Xylariomycetidae sp. FL2044]|nr:Arylsulphatase [Xylariomycetidae sp. FL2044]
MKLFETRRACFQALLAGSTAANYLSHAQLPFAAREGGLGSAKKPNIVFILTDDQDLHLDSLNYMPLVQKHLSDKGTTYKRHFCTTAICCPSRVTLWTGKASHNTNVTDVSPPYGGYPKFVSQGLNESYLPLWLQDAGYNTYYTGKMFNAHTVENYNAPYLSGWNGSDFLLDPYTYCYLNSTYQRDHDAPSSYAGQYSVDVLAEKAYGFLDDAVTGGQPFFLGLAPVAPHSNCAGTNDTGFTPPIAAERHKNLFPNVTVPRTTNFNPDVASGASWIKNLSQQTQEMVDYGDEFYRSRLRALQSVDELVEGVVTRLEEYGILEDTYIIYTSDNGFHIGQHRMAPGKECGYEEDTNVPLIIRGPGVSENFTTEIVTTHTDMAPTLLTLAGVSSLRSDFDGSPIPVSESSIGDAVTSRQEHVNIEYWGSALVEGTVFPGFERYYGNNTYKGLRVASDAWNVYYSVWCNGDHELYNLKNDPGQMTNLLSGARNVSARSTTLNGYATDQLVSRLDALMMVLKSCKGDTCIRPWQALHPAGNVENLSDAMAARFDSFYNEDQAKVAFDRCEAGYIIDAEGPQFDTDGVVYYDGSSWSDWT